MSENGRLSRRRSISTGFEDSEGPFLYGLKDGGIGGLKGSASGVLVGLERTVACARSPGTVFCPVIGFRESESTEGQQTRTGMRWSKRRSR